MKIIWCWRCKMPMPMLDKDDYAITSKMFSGVFNSR